MNQSNGQDALHISGIAAGHATGGIQNTGKVSPTPQQLISSGQKIIPAHQIKIVKKDGMSPSPESRGFFTLK
jgi:hypothetical protein